MKTLKLLCLLVFISTNCFSQLGCIVSDTGSYQNGYDPNIKPCNLPTDAEVYGYVPWSYDYNVPTSYFRVNFIFLTHPTIPTQYSALTMQQLTDNVDATVFYINQQFQNCGNIPSNLVPPNPSPLVNDSRVRIVRNNVYRFDSPLAIGKYSGNPIFFNTHPLDTANTLNIYFYTDTASGDSKVSGSGWAGPQGYACMPLEALPFPQNLPNGYLRNQGLIWHEICHCLGFLGDNYDNPALYKYDNSLPTFGAYRPNDAFIDTNAYNCNNPASMPSNNVMGSSNCRKHMSAMQIGAFHYLVAKGFTKKYTQYIYQSYPYTPPAPYVTLPANYDLTGTQTLYSLAPFSTLTIKSGANITIRDQQITVPLNAKIIVEQGARLNLKCLSISLHPQITSGKWDGIEVWGTPSTPQTIQSNGLNSNQGILDMDNCYISKARKAVLVGKRNPPGYQNTYGFGGGVLLANNVDFENNEEDISMNPSPGTNPNLTFISNCVFRRSNTFTIPGPSVKRGMVNLRDVNAIKFYSNKFVPARNLNEEDTTICIRGINSSIIAKNINEFDSAFYAIHLVGGLNSDIDGNSIYTRNGIYMGNSNYNRIVNNQFRLDFVPNYAHSNSLRTGIYMNECNNFKIEKNDIATVNINQNISQGICINNSGPLASQVYNNSLRRLHQGIWCQNQNYDPNSLTEDGLKLNCNDFNFCTYNIGVQTPMVIGYGFPVATYVATNWQSGFSQYCYNGGIAKTQGLANSANTDNVRNTYRNVQASGNENKFYSYTPYSTPPQVIHGSFKEPLAPAPPRFGVGPYNQYCDTFDVNNIEGSNFAPASKGDYCPDLSAKASKSALTKQLGILNHGIDEAVNAFEIQLDGGNTQGLLNNIQGSIGALLTSLKNNLVKEKYLSDAVLISYFTKKDVLPAHIEEVFKKNAPVSRKVWAAVVARGLPVSVMHHLNDLQEANRLSPRAETLAKISLMKNERSYVITHKSMILMEDPGTTHVKDSVAALIRMNQQGDVARQLIELDFAFRDYAAAREKLSAYSLPNAHQKDKYVGFKKLVVGLMQKDESIYILAMDNTLKKSVENVARDYDHPCMQEARNILFSVFDTYYPEQKLVPERKMEKGTERKMVQTAPPSAEEKQTELPDAAIALYPNPAGNEFYINNKTGHNFHMVITNVNGQVMIRDDVKAYEVTKTATDALINGVYFVNLYNNKVLVKTSKLVIVK